MDPIEHLVHQRGAELRAAADEHRRARRQARPTLPLRLYSRLWWSARPRAAAWTPGLLPAT